MKWMDKYIETAEKIILKYKGELPLQHHLKNYFSRNKKHGSKDRKIITHFCYTYFRLGKALAALSFRERLIVALFLCENDLTYWQALFNNAFLALHDAELHIRINNIKNIYPDFTLTDIFPLYDNTGDIEVEKFLLSFFIQPHIFLRMRPGRKLQVLSHLRNAELPFKMTDENIVAISPGVNLQSLITINKDAVIQDESSAGVADYFSQIDQKNIHSIWDCCAASGGKTILAKDYFPHSKITVSDIRPSIIKNLKARLIEAKIDIEKYIILDLSRNNLLDKQFDLIICDVPCSGSGTWSRTPEQISFFKKEKIDEYAHLQRRIICNTIVSAVENGYFLYITCSVFMQENEQNVLYIKQQFPQFNHLHSGYIRGYERKADTMFVALFKKGIQND